MRRVYNEIKSFIKKRELFPKIAALMFAVILWAYIASIKIGEFSFRAPIEVKNLSNLLLVSNMQYKFVTIILKGKKDILKTVNVKNIKAVVNLENPVIGKSEKYPIEVNRNELADNISIYLSKKKVSITIEMKLKKLIRVIPIISGMVKSGYVLGNIRVNPEFVTIYGPESKINDIESLKTRLISIANETKTITKEIPIDKSELKNIEFVQSKVTVVIPVIESTNLLKFEKAVSFKNINKDFEYELINSNKIKLFVRTPNEDLRLTEKDFDVFVDFGQFNIDKNFKSNDNKHIIKEFTVKVSIKSKRDDVRLVYTIPEKVSVRIIRK